MKSSRKQARRRLNSIKTKSELTAILNQTTLTLEQKQAVYMVFGCGMTRVKAARELGRSLSFINKAICASYDKLI